MISKWEIPRHTGNSLWWSDTGGRSSRSKTPGFEKAYNSIP